jgi:DNA-binding transcriptional LysR family regulator
MEPRAPPPQPAAPDAPRAPADLHSPAPAGMPNDEQIGSIPPLHSLVAFEAIARHRSISSAARELGVTRSALSHSVNLLEHRLQVRLLRRSHPTVDLTRAGLLYLDAVQDFARALGDSLYRLSQDARTTLRLAVCPALSRLWLGARLPRFHDLHPRIDLNVTLLDDADAEVLGRADVALRYAAQLRTDMLAMPLWRETVVAVAAPALAAQTLDIEPQTLVQAFPLVQISQFSWDAWLQGPVGCRAVQRATLVTPDLVYGLETAASGVGIALAPRRLASRYLEQKRLAVASRFEATGSYYHAITLESSAARAPVAAFLGWLAGEVHDTREQSVGVKASR